jgi:uncharacterized membrane protein YebE (DUF533 family)
MKDLLKNKKVLVGLLALGVVAYYVYGQKRKADLKARAEELANTTPPEIATSQSTASTPVKLEKELQAPSSAEDVFSGKRNKNTLI